MDSNIFDSVSLTLEFDLLFKNFNLAYNFWTVSARALIFHMIIPCDKTFQWVPLFFTLWPWPWSLTHFLKTLTLLITVELWVLELWYFTWVLLVIRPLSGYHYFFTLWPWPLSLTYFLKTLTLLITFELWVLELWYFTWVFLVIRPIVGTIIFYLVTLTWECDIFFFLNLILLITFE